MVKPHGLCRQEFLNRCRIEGDLLKVRTMRTLLEYDHPSIWNTSKDRLGAGWGDLVVSATRDQGWLRDAR